MTGRERILAAFRGERPDTVPIMLHNFMMAAREAAITMETFRTDPTEIARAFAESVDRYGYDGILVDVDTVTLAAAAGVPVDRPRDEPARVAGSRIQSLEELNDLEPPDVGSSPGVQVWLEAVRLLVEQFGGEILIRGNCDQCPFTLASMIRGMSAWMEDLLDPAKEEAINRLLAFSTDLTMQFITLMASTGADILSNGDSMAGPELVSPAIYRRYALPWEQPVARRAHELGRPYVLHICGSTLPILTEMLESGADGFELDHRTDARSARERMRDRAVFLGNIDPSGVLARGSVREVEEATRRLLAIFTNTPRFVLNAGCAIPADTPAENLRAMIRTARTAHA
jgi:MtaA/CmuA family methyltransferase